MRIVVLVSAVVLLVGGCSTSQTPQTTQAAPTTQAGTSSPTSAMTRAETITWARGIDPCALIEREDLEMLGTVSAIGTAGSSTGCAATIAAGADRETTVRWSIAVTPNDFHTADLGTLEEVDGTDVLVSFDYRPPEYVTTDAEPATFGDRDGYRSVHDGTTIAEVIVGDGFAGVGAAGDGRLVPVVAVNGDDTAVVVDVMAAVLQQLPA